MIEIARHALKAMEDDEITEDEIKAGLEHGELEIKQLVKGEMRYGNKLDTKEKTIMVIYTYKNGNKRIITCYTIRRKKWQNK